MLALLYFGTARLGQLLAMPPGNITPVWIPSGIILAAVLLRGYRVWPGIFLGAFAGNVWAYFTTASGGALLRCVLAGTANGAGDTLGAVVSAYLITKATGGRDPLGRAADVVKFIAYGGILGAGISAVCGVTALGLAGLVPWHNYVTALTTWWTGDGVGVLVVAPLLLAWRAGWRGCRFGREEALFMLVLPAASLVSLLLFPGVPGLIILPLLLWAVFRFDRRVLLAGIAVEAALVTVMAAMGYGPFVRESMNHGLVQLQLFLTLMTVPILVLCGALTENARVRDRLRALTRTLNTRVQERTRRLAAELVERTRAEAALQQANTALRAAVLQHQTALEQLQVQHVELERQNEELRTAQAELDAARARYFDLYDQAPVGYVTLSDQGLILEANLTAATLLGVNRRALVKQPLAHFILTEDQDIFYRHYQQLLATTTPQAFELRIVKKTAEPGWVRLDATTAQDAAGARVCRIVLSDITALRQAEDELQKLLKLQSVGTLAGGIAHDFNNIMMGLFGNISLAKDGLAREHPSHTLLEEAEKSMNRAVRLTKQLLTFAKGGDPVKESVSLGALIEEVAHFDLSGSNVSLVYQPAPALWPAAADRGQIQQVVSNIIINARQAMPHGGHLYITLENAAVPVGAMVGLPAGNYVKIIIRDEGAGIAAKHFEHLFEPYFTTRPAGHGLGLATAYAIIHKHGGHISVVSELGHGTTFTLYLPASAALPPAEPAAAAAGPAPARAHSILVMDDEEPLRKIVALMLQACGYAVVTAPDGQAAIAQYRQARAAGAPFDAVIMDLTVPGGLGGEEAVKDILAMEPRAKVIVSSGYADDPVLANYADYGFSGIVVKPYTKRELQEVLSRVLQK